MNVTQVNALNLNCVVCAHVLISIGQWFRSATTNHTMISWHSLDSSIWDVFQLIVWTCERCLLMMRRQPFGIALEIVVCYRIDRWYCFRNFPLELPISATSIGSPGKANYSRSICWSRCAIFFCFLFVCFLPQNRFSANSRWFWKSSVCIIFSIIQSILSTTLNAIANKQNKKKRNSMHSETLIYLIRHNSCSEHRSAYIFPKVMCKE